MFRYLTLRGVRILKQSQYSSSLSPLAAASPSNSNTSSSENTKVHLDNKNTDLENKLPSGEVEHKIKSKLVASVFDSLKNEDFNFQPGDSKAESMITLAKNVDSLLSNVSPTVSRQNALKIVSILADWTCAGQIRTSDFEDDKRFQLLCQILGKPSSLTTKPYKPTKIAAVTDDLATVLGVTGDDEAAKIISNLTLHHMIKVIVTLGFKKRRSLPVLRSLAFNIGKSSEKLNIKQGADILYASAQLNFYDEVLFEKVCTDLCECVPINTKRAVVGSIITSLGLMKYKATELLDLLSEWTVQHITSCHTQDLVTLLLTLATVNHIPQTPKNLFQSLMEHLSPKDLPSATIWLDAVWSLVVLNKASQQEISSVLSTDFLEKLCKENISVGSKLKLLNINGSAKLRIKGYTGPTLDLSDERWKITIQRSKEKQALVTSVIDTLSNLVPSSSYILQNVNTDMGFYIDGECLVDSKLTPLPLVDKTGQSIDRSSSRGIKVAILVLDYHDMTRGNIEPTGVACLANDLTQLLGFRVIRVQHTDFSPHDKLVSRVKYLKELLRTAVQQS